MTELIEFCAKKSSAMLGLRFAAINPSQEVRNLNEVSVGVLWCSVGPHNKGTDPLHGCLLHLRRCAFKALPKFPREKEHSAALASCTDQMDCIANPLNRHIGVRRENTQIGGHLKLNVHIHQFVSLVSKYESKGSLKS